MLELRKSGKIILPSVYFPRGSYLHDIIITYKLKYNHATSDSYDTDYGSPTHYFKRDFEIKLQFLFFSNINKATSEVPPRTYQSKKIKSLNFPDYRHILP